MIGIAGPSLLSGQSLIGGAALPEVAAILDVDNDWTFIDGGETEPDGYLVIDGDGDPAVDDTLTSGLPIGIDLDGDPYVEVP